MALRNKIFIACESLLRVPPLLVIDEIFRCNFGLSDKWRSMEGGILSSDRRVPEYEVVLAKHPQGVGAPVTGFGSNVADFLSSFLQTLWSYVGGASGSTLSNESLITGSEQGSHFMRVELGGMDIEHSTVGEVLKLFTVLVLLQRKVLHLFL